MVDIAFFSFMGFGFLLLYSIIGIFTAYGIHYWTENKISQKLIRQICILLSFCLWPIVWLIAIASQMISLLMDCR